MMLRRIPVGFGALAALICISCDRVPLLAPTNSTVTIDAGSRFVALGDSTSVTATVLESSGTPVQNGTVVRFATSLGRVDPVEAQTRNGIATTTFFAGNDSGVAEVRATSGGAGGATGSTGNGTGTTTATTSTSGNVVQIAVGSGAVDTVTVRANPSTVSTTSGGTVTLIATVVGTGGRLLAGIPVSFSASRGTLSSTSALTDAQGEARVSLTTNADTDISVAAGTKTATTKVTGQPGPSVTLTCAVGAATNCASVSIGQNVIFTAQRAQGSSSLASATLDFGDGQSVNLGNLAGAVSVAHSYTQSGSFSARLSATDVNGESTVVIQPVQVTPVSAAVTASLGTGRNVSATATVSAPVTQYQWTWDDGATTTTTSATTSHTYAAAGTYSIRVTATLQAGGTITADAAPVTVP